MSGIAHQSDDQESETRQLRMGGQATLLCPALLTARLRIDRPGYDDVSDIVFHAGNPDIAKLLTRSGGFGADDARRLVETGKNAVAGAQDRHVLAIRLKTTGRLIGIVSATRRPSDNWAEIHFWIGAVFRRRDYASEALTAISEQLLRHNDIDRIGAQVAKGHLAAARVLEKCSYHYLPPLSVTAAAGQTAPTYIAFELCREDRRAGSAYCRKAETVFG